MREQKIFFPRAGKIVPLVLLFFGVGGSALVIPLGDRYSDFVKITLPYGAVALIFCGVVFLLQFWKKLPQLSLDADGFSIKTLHRETRYLWHEVDTFTITKIQRNTFITWNTMKLSPNEPAKKQAMNWLASPNIIGDIYNIGILDLQKIMQQYLNSYLDEHNLSQ